MSRSTTWLALLCAGSALGCDVFDESLEQRIESSMDDEEDAGVDAGPRLFELAQCNKPRPPMVVQGSDMSMNISVAGLTSSIRETGCDVPASVLGGADGYFEIHANAGERWHFHLDAAPGQDLAVMALGGCSELRSCAGAANVCGVGESEHFTFVADAAGTYAVVIEGIDVTRSEPLSLLAIRPTCGDGKKEHGEVCDLGDLTPGDGCDASCRIELRENRAEETEPNDDTYLANVIAPNNDDPVQVIGKVAGTQCQPDYYLIRNAETRILTTALLGANGKACKGAPPMELALYEADGRALDILAPVDSATSDGDVCPSLAPQLLPAGAYFVQVRHTKASPTPFAYRLDLSWSATAP